VIGLHFARCSKVRNRECCLREQQAFCSILQLRSGLDCLLCLLFAQMLPVSCRLRCGGGVGHGGLRFTLGAACPQWRVCYLSHLYQAAAVCGSRGLRRLVLASCRGCDAARSVVHSDVPAGHQPAGVGRCQDSYDVSRAPLRTAHKRTVLCRMICLQPVASLLAFLPYVVSWATQDALYSCFTYSWYALERAGL
jgi:hypothetical protein